MITLITNNLTPRKKKKKIRLPMIWTYLLPLSFNYLPLICGSLL